MMRRRRRRWPRRGRAFTFTSRIHVEVDPVDVNLDELLVRRIAWGPKRRALPGGRSRRLPMSLGARAARLFSPIEGDAASTIPGDRTATPKNCLDDRGMRICGAWIDPAAR